MEEVKKETKEEKLEEKKEHKKEELRKQQISKFLKENYILILILLLSVCSTLYFFNVAKNQALWWDEAEYVSTAKHWVMNLPYDINPQRPPLFQALEALVFLTGLGELTIKLLLVVVPFWILIILVYLLGKEMFNKNAGLIAAFLTSVSWTFLFWSARAQPDFLSIVFQVLAVLFMWKYWKHDKSIFAILAGAFAALGFLFKISGLLIPVIFIAFIYFKDGFKAIKNKNYWYFAAAFIIVLIPNFIWSYATFHDPVAIFHSGYSDAIGTPKPFGWYNLDFFFSLTTPGLSFRQGGFDIFQFLLYSPFFLLFLIGVVMAFSFILYFDLIIKDRKKVLNPNIFSLWVLIAVSAFYIFYSRGTEDRWVFLWMPFIFFLIAKALFFIYDKVKKYNKQIALIIILALLALGAYWQVTYASALIDNKVDSYMPIKLGGLWMKDHSQPGDKILSISYTQTVYYTERNVTSFSLLKSPAEFNKYIKENQPIKYIEISIFEPHPNWTQQWLEQSQNKLIPVQVYSAAQNQPVAVIYALNSSASW